MHSSTSIRLKFSAAFSNAVNIDIRFYKTEFDISFSEQLLVFEKGWDPVIDLNQFRQLELSFLLKNSVFYSFLLV